MAGKVFTIIASTINGEIQEFPKRVEIPCWAAFAAGEAIIRDYDANFCIVNKKIFLLGYGKNVFGTTQFKTHMEWVKFQNTLCQCCPPPSECCFLLYNNCKITYNGNPITISGN